MPIWCVICKQTMAPRLLLRELQRFAKMHGLVLEDCADLRDKLDEISWYLDDANKKRRSDTFLNHCRKHARPKDSVLVA